MNARVTPPQHGLGWRGPSPADPRDRLYVPTREALASAPATTADLSVQMGAVRNQMDEGACTGFASAKVALQAYTEDGWHHPFEPSPRFIYWNERVVLQTSGQVPNATQQDTGGYGRLAMQVIHDYGITAEHNCLYAPDGEPLDSLAVAPDPAAFANAYKHGATSYHAVALAPTTIQALLASQHAFFAGITVYASFEGAQASQTGIIPMPQANEAILGGHELPFCQFVTDGSQVYVKFMNSWDTSWGDKGFGYLPIQYLTNPSLASDAWTIIVQH